MVLASTATGGLRKAHEAMLAGTPKMPSHPNGTPWVVSVDPTVIGRFVDVTADLSRVEVRLDGRLVAAHDRSWARGRTITDPAHVAAANVLREQYQSPRPVAGAHSDHEELGRDLAEYDQAFGLLDALTEGEVA